MLHLVQQPTKPIKHPLHVGLAHGKSEILEAQRLRYRVFAEEMGARLQTKIPGVGPGLLRPLLRTPDRARRSDGQDRRHLPDTVAGGPPGAPAAITRRPSSTWID